MGSSAQPRPLSPHLQIWRFTVTMAASITHRGTGIILYGGTILLVAWAACLAAGEGAYDIASGIARAPIGLIVIAGYVWAMCFHLLNGLRHLYWDSGRGLAVETAKRTAWAVYIGSVVLAAIVLVAGLSAGGA
ncbi:MAG: succinate dehydrogenase, cytochrome b556 subunit [Parvularculaceae bacterium]